MEYTDLTGGTSVKITFSNFRQEPYTSAVHPNPLWIAPSTPTECSGDVHVFACQKCRTCKCGKARLCVVKVTK